ncbi:MAG: DUF1206 domain-containing protein [Planctomycetota bacterium]|nr:DUF1206 domain-containing protein [Planctomycetaceae bacterium]MDQ3331393.1 DUF1206 domain-containing protein [Planctomycetota bacterium]
MSDAFPKIQRLRRRFFAPLQAGFKPGERWLEYVARAGYSAKGIVYGVVGILAVQAALSAARSPDTRDALESIRTAPFGRILLGLVAVGLVGYSVWRLAQAWWDTERKGREWKGLAVRTGFVFSAIANFGLAILAGTAAFRSSSASGDGGSGNRQHAAELLQWPGGWIVLVVAGLVVIGVGVGHFVLAYKADFMRDYEHIEMSQTERDWARPIGRFGLSARGVTFCLIGLFLALAGWRTNAGEVKGLGKAFNIVAAQPFGQVLLILVAVGFIAYGIFCLSQAKYRRIEKV